MTYRTLSRIAAALVVLVTIAGGAAAQCPVSPLTTGLKAPTKLAFSTRGNLLVAEQGDGVNTGRISIIDPASGSRRTLIDGLPSGFAAPNNDQIGRAHV